MSFVEFHVNLLLYVHAFTSFIVQELQSKPTSSPADLQRIQSLEKDLSQRDVSISELHSQLDSVRSELSVRTVSFGLLH